MLRIALHPFQMALNVFVFVHVLFGEMANEHEQRGKNKQRVESNQ